MSNGMFVLVLAVGAGLLAMWVQVRFPSLAPERFGRTALHLAVAIATVSVAPNMTSMDNAFSAIFLVVLPALVYMFLSTLWMLRHAQTAMGVS